MTWSVTCGMSRTLSVISQQCTYTALSGTRSSNYLGATNSLRRPLTAKTGSPKCEERIEVELWGARDSYLYIERQVEKSQRFVYAFCGFLLGLLVSFSVFQKWHIIFLRKIFWPRFIVPPEPPVSTPLTALHAAYYHEYCDDRVCLSVCLYSSGTARQSIVFSLQQKFCA